jgi:starvation-inducible DNA-binding protein
MPAKTTDPNAKVKQPRFPTHIDLPAASRSGVIELLNTSLAACFDLMSQTKQAHWNVKGREFYSLHLLFDVLAGELAEYVDDLAERATALGGYATGTVRMAASASILPEYPTDAIDGMEHVAALVERFAAFGAHVRDAIDACADEHGDQDSADLYTEISRGIDKRLWFLEAHIQDREV